MQAPGAAFRLDVADLGIFGRRKAQPTDESLCVAYLMIVVFWGFSDCPQRRMVRTVRERACEALAWENQFSSQLTPRHQQFSLSGFL
jgi:hypothetical protein